VITTVVKGTTRRVIVIKTPDPRYFEEAIFIVKEDVNVSGVAAADVLKEAETVAKQFVKTKGKKPGIHKKIAPLAYLAIGAVLSAVTMLLL